MFNRIYLEESIRNHPRVNKIVARFPDAKIILCERYGEVFNPKSQNFRLQKQKPALILAQKHKNFVIPAPAGYGIGSECNFYFSHMLNCLYDCRYCFLQGMYQSANYVLFVNYEDFQSEIHRIASENAAKDCHFFSGYDCDSLALEPVTGFIGEFLPFFENLPNAWLEIRTKSTQIRVLTEIPPNPRCIAAFSLSPQAIADKLEAKAPPLERRLAAIEKLQSQGWPIGLRFDPLIYHSGFKASYGQFFSEVFARIRPETLHSVSLGAFRLPENFFKKIHKLYPNERLFASPLESQVGMVSYRHDLEQELLSFCTGQILSHIPKHKFFPCHH